MSEAKASELPEGGTITEPGSSRNYRTGDWRSKRPVFIPEKCINCLTCWMYCPDSAVIVKDGKVNTLSQSFTNPEWVFNYLGPGFFDLNALMPDQYYMMGALKGITFTGATGDAGGSVSKSEACCCSCCCRRCWMRSR
jgi:2-oxoacid:acceptor oxidoreductase delta subunit (pyruvate/2-ketoisovalerate family)